MRGFYLGAIGLFLSAILAVGNTAHAEFTEFTNDQAGFEAAAGTVVTSDLSGISDGSTLSAINSLTDDATLDPGDIEDGVQIQSAQGDSNFNIGGDLAFVSGAVGPGNDSQAVLVTFIGVEVLAASVDVVTEGSSTSASVDVYDTSGTLITRGTLTDDGSFGVVNDAPIGFIIVNQPVDGSGSLERISSVSFAGGGAAGDADVLQETADEPAGTNCENGGTVVSAGKDANDNAILDEDEIETMEFVCDEADGGATGGSDGCSVSTGGGGGTSALLLLLLGCVLARRRY